MVTMYSQEVEAYAKHKHLKNAASELGINFQTLYSRLRRAGVSVTGDKERYGSTTDKLAVVGEQLFLGLVPHADDLNQKSFQPEVDFSVGSSTVDVKTARPKCSNNSYGSERWAFCLRKQMKTADYFVCFGLEETGEEIEILLLIPREMLRPTMQTLSVPRSKNSKWCDFEITESELARFFSEEPF